MGPSPRSLAVEANDCFMVRPLREANRIQGRGATLRALYGGLPSVRFAVLSDHATCRLRDVSHKALMPKRKRSAIDAIFLTEKGPIQAVTLNRHGNLRSSA
jgi:hypothetical protein